MRNARRGPRHAAVPSLVIGCALIAACAQEGSGDGSNEPAIPRLAAAVPATLLSCSDLVTLAGFANTTITSATLVAAAPVAMYSETLATPDHCWVQGKMNQRVSAVDGKPYAIGFEMRLPVAWNGRFFYQANEGADGSITGDNRAFGNMLGGSPLTNALEQGFAVLSSDAGHEPDPAYASTINDETFGIDPQARVDYGYNAVAQLTPMAKNLIKVAYGKGPDRSYMVGCSNGGRHSFVAASRFADAYDGILAGAPGLHLPKAAVAQMWDTQALATVAPMDPASGRPNIGASFSPAEMMAVSRGILDKCDALDGVADGMVSDTAQCQAAFSLTTDVPTCAGAQDGTCLSAAQKVALLKVFDGARNSSGTALYNSWPFDPGIGSLTWRIWKLGLASNPEAGGAPLPPNNVEAGAPSMAFIFSTPAADPAVLTGNGTTELDYALGFSFDTDAAKIFATDAVHVESPWTVMTPPNPTKLSTLRNRGAKLMVVQGSADPVFSLDDTLDWYAALNLEHAGRARDFARMFVVPGMNHCENGPATDQFDMVTALVNWVENGQAPDSVLGTSRTSKENVGLLTFPDLPANRTRPLCAYPKVATYKGSGSIEDATAFACK